MELHVAVQCCVPVVRSACAGLCAVVGCRTCGRKARLVRLLRCGGLSVRWHSLLWALLLMGEWLTAVKLRFHINLYTHT